MEEHNQAPRPIMATDGSRKASIEIDDKDFNLLWRAHTYNANHQLTEFNTGNGLVTNRTYEQNTGRLLEIQTSSANNIFQDLIYSYDDFGNFALRRKMNSPVISETFTYDNFNRLVSSTKNGTEYRMSYDKYGRILSKEMQGMNFFDARYHSDKPHALKKYTSYTEPPFSNHSVTYTDFDKVKTVSMNGNTLQFVYGHDHHRRYMTETVDSVTRSKTYIGNCEFVQSATEGNHALTYLYGPSGIYAVAKKVGDNETLYYVHTDHLGSWNVVTDRYRRIVHQYYFDAWGDAKIVDGDGISVNKPLFDRGFTGHEHHYDFGLINMNGRMYDPYTSMFLSPDNYIQAPDNSQSFNRYAYCLNNPLKYTDPSGEFWHLAIGAALGGITNLAFNWNNCDGWQDYVSYFAIGAVAGGLGAGVGTGVSSAIAGGGFAAGFTGASTASATGFVAGATIGGASGFTGGFITGAGNSLVAGDSFGRSLYNGTIDVAIGLGTGAIIGGVAGGIDAYKSNRNFWTGNAIQYEMDVAYLASMNGGNEIYLNDYTVVNNSDYIAYYKPEDGVCGIGDCVIEPHKGINVKVDGVATYRYSDKVYKIPGKWKFSPKATINIDGDVFVDINDFVSFVLDIPIYKYGWMTIDELDDSWRTLFEAALKIK